MQALKVNEDELVPVYETSTGEKVVYGTELYENLGSKRQYTDWIKKRLRECDAVEQEDYQSFSQNNEKPSGGRPKLEYIIKLDIAKEMAMLERNAKGKQVRRYFIQIEKKYKASGQITSQDNSALLETFQKFMQMQIEFMERQDKFNRSIEDKINSFEMCLPDKGNEDFANAEKEIILEERMQCIYDLVRENAELRDKSVSKMLHLMYKELERACNISLNAYRSVYRSETDKPEASMVEVIAANDRIYELALKFNRYLKNKFMEREALKEAESV